MPGVTRQHNARKKSGRANIKSTPATKAALSLRPYNDNGTKAREFKKKNEFKKNAPETGALSGMQLDIKRCNTVRTPADGSPCARAVLQRTSARCRRRSDRQ